MSSGRQQRGDVGSAARRRVLVALVLSFLVHIPVAYVGGASLLHAPTVEGEPTYFEVMPYMSDSTDPEEITEEDREEDESYDPDEAVPDGQIVPTEEAGEERRPEDPEFLSDRDQVVERQTKARNRLPADAEASLAATVPRSQGAQPQPADFEPRDRPLMASLTVLEQGLENADEGDHFPDQAPPPTPPTPLELEPTLSSLVDATGGAGMDSIEDVESGEHNLLSSARWLHAPFMQRFSRQVEQHWYPDVDASIRRHDPGGHIYGYRNRTTVVRVVLNASGELERAYVVSESGATYLDDVAVRSIEAAAPVPNPPRGLVDEDTGTIVFSFGFTVHFRERPILRLRRYR